ncbi:peptidase S8 and S53 subtilisin kexin sedolisin [Ferroglobus placidus DSM 10642]|uniref:Peptidase S8 and S53 subtilisin kexin sedolisin n=1 Tax=Ferroglobus placidus (strain DSM 10642 / AEDII12DO) TaxID=589924 RepID=D3S0G2_FERPA|nr:S8 family peptidase [Ferroglobus placidus]ADC66225.1 peptidase S8 and S53 subtilisin kexin sedolisin [Ferroglobus placidus DSM 10642]
MGHKELAVLLAVILILIAGIAVAAETKNVRVIIKVNEKFDENVISANNGKVLARGKIFPIVVAELPEKAVENLAKAKGVVRIEKDALVKIFKGKPPSPPGKNKDSSAQPSQQIPWGIDRINATEAWNISNGSASGVIEVAIIDTGIDRDHPDLKDNLAWGVSVLNGIISTKPNAYQDKNGHGTHVAGIIAAVDNEIGVVGVAPAVEIYAIKALGNDGSGWISDIILGIEQALLGPDGVLDSDKDGVIAGDPDDDAAEVISMSFGSSSNVLSLHEALIKAYSYGVVLVAASGNEGALTPSYPAAYPEVIAVGATDKNDDVPSWSNRGVELSAPGVDILSTYPDDDYATLSGTSMACPHVSGVVALIQAAYYNKYGTILPVGNFSDANNSTVRGILHITAEDVNKDGYDSVYGYGIVRADLALKEIS